MDRRAEIFQTITSRAKHNFDQGNKFFPLYSKQIHELLEIFDLEPPEPEGQRALEFFGFFIPLDTKDFSTLKAEELFKKAKEIRDAVNFVAFFESLTKNGTFTRI